MIDDFYRLVSIDSNISIGSEVAGEKECQFVNEMTGGGCTHAASRLIVYTHPDYEHPRNALACPRCAGQFVGDVESFVEEAD